ncbi:MAG: peptidyl-alpha-hydroxyglycine alpha-amidating lyase family protein [Dehalococcoidales bacterium]|nr:peptidyl-alpha-hydroxyglycine alpha-amidating lyase family protein [Dehalococcoidales bacterium]
MGVQKPSYRVIEGWEQLPEGYHHLDVAGISVDSKDRVYVLTRSEPRVLVYERDGSFVTSWGEGTFTNRTHGLTIGPDGSIFCVDDGDHTVRKFSPDGKLLMMIGHVGIATDTGYDGKTIDSIKRGGGPFNRPTNVAVAPNGELYVADGYGNCQVHRFTAVGQLIQSWGEPGTGPGQFHLPHGIAVDPEGRVWVTDRENDRIQIFSPDGKFLEEWTDVQRPTQVRIDPERGLVYVSENWWRKGDTSFVHGPIEEAHYGRVSIFDLDGHVLTRWGGKGCDPTAAGFFSAPHELCVDSHGDMYVGEVTWSHAVKLGLIAEDAHTFQKFERID